MGKVRSGRVSISLDGAWEEYSTQKEAYRKRQAVLRAALASKAHPAKPGETEGSGKQWLRWLGWAAVGTGLAAWALAAPGRRAS